ncbi:gamma-glutamyl-gamma-aminobutyrate hydrolase family protein, partial [Acinetobacter baumannii]|nr:gamma-glutamyl-gamma-aminobutyrate hydrolase family protein [Acinetobacter baumannii]
EPLLIERGYTVRYLEAGVDAIDRATVTAADLLVVLGGPIGVYQTDRYPFLAEEKAAIAARLGQDKPTLGICLGAQLMAEALGATVAPTGK